MHKTYFGPKKKVNLIFIFGFSAELVAKDRIEYNDLVDSIKADSVSCSSEQKMETSNEAKGDYFVWCFFFTSLSIMSHDQLFAYLFFFSSRVSTNLLCFQNQKDSRKDSRDLNDPIVRLKRDCVGIMAAFRINKPFRHIVIVANTHLYW